MINMPACQLEQFAEQSKKILEIFSDRNKLKQQLLSVKEDETLFSLSEHYDILDKIVLYADEKYRIRLHIFGEGYFDRPHNHRWSVSV
jgi:hypothetical protein